MFILLIGVIVCLWGNSTDLSLLIDMSEEQIKSLQSTGGDALAATEKNILGNHLTGLWDTVKAIKDKQGGRIDFVLDNAGFELYCDCVYGKVYPSHILGLTDKVTFIADFLIQAGIATEVVFHGKRYPWFVSDVTKKDWEWLLNSMVYGHLFPKATDQELSSLKKLGLRWKVGLPSWFFYHELIFVFRNTRSKENGSTSNIRSGVPVSPSGTFTAKPRICSYICPRRNWCSSRAI